MFEALASFPFEPLCAPSFRSRIMTVSATKRLVLVGLGNYTHPLTRHSVGQLLLKNLALRALASPLFSSSGSPNFTLTRASESSKHSSWTTLITLTPLDAAKPPVELLFLLPKALMNVSGPTVVESCRSLLPPLAQRQRSPSPPLPSPPPPPPEEPVEPHPDPSHPFNLYPRKPRHPPRRSLKPPPPPPKPMYRLLAFADDLDSPPSSIKYQRGGGPKGHNGIRSLSSALPGQGGSKDFHRVWIGIGRPERREHVPGWVLGAVPGEEVRALEWDEGRGRGGEALEKAWEEVVRVAYEED
ncbi:hypothetical protein JCM8547_004405 [Rhodosporidiobolus lusitaniae]